jgi:prolipoprotein diacylglyceryl transferase
VTPTSIPSPAQPVWHLGPLAVHGYAVCVIVSVTAGLWIGRRRWMARGGAAADVTDLALWMVPAGLVGARLYHVVTSPDAYFGRGGHPVQALEFWRPGLAVWGAIGGGFAAGYIYTHFRYIPRREMADALAPALLVSQAIGRLGNYINQEIFGRPTDLPWAVQIDPIHRPLSSLQAPTYHPTFLYELLWDLALAALLVWGERRFRVRRGRVFAYYVLGYVVFRIFMEFLRVDPAHSWLGLRVNAWVCLVLGVGAIGYLILNRPARANPGAAPEALPETASSTPASRSVSAPDGEPSAP